MFWFRTEKQIQERLLETLNQLITYPNPLFVKIVGEQRYCDGTGTMVELLQCGELNKQLFFKLLDVILLELFPELGELKWLLFLNRKCDNYMILCVPLFIIIWVKRKWIIMHVVGSE